MLKLPPEGKSWSSHRGSVVMHPTSTHEDEGSTPGPPQWVKDLALSQAEAQVTNVAQIWCCVAVAYEMNEIPI